MTELKRCPFCGGKAELISLGDDEDAFVKCTKCECRTTRYTAKASYCALDKALETWNRRVDDGGLH